MKEFMQEVNAYFPKEQEIELSNGEKIKLKKLTWGLECQLSRVFGEILDKISEESSMSVTSLEGEAQIFSSKFIALLLKHVPESLTEVVCLVTDLKKDYVENELVLEDVIKIVSPFFVTFSQKIKNLIPDLQKRIQEATQEQSQK